jgi:hypothetical protein
MWYWGTKIYFTPRGSVLEKSRSSIGRESLNAGFLRSSDRLILPLALGLCGVLHNFHSLSRKQLWIGSSSIPVLIVSTSTHFTIPYTNPK